MKLKALDQVHVSSVKPDSLRPGEEFEVSDEVGKSLLKAHPQKFQQVGQQVSEKAEAAPKNKAEGAAPANKAKTQRKNKGEKKTPV